MAHVVSPQSLARSPWEVAADLIDPQPNPYLGDPVRWVRDVLGEFIWSKQVEIMNALTENRYVAVRASHDVSKSHTASRFVSYWMETHGVGEAFAVTTAPTHRQVHAVLWRELGKAHRKGNLSGRIMLKDEWYMGAGGGKELVAYGAKPADYDPSAFNGIHSRFPLIVVDEAGGVAKTIFDAVDSLATNFHARVLAIGNPDDPSAHFATICKPGSGWQVLHISAFDTPAFTGEEVPDSLLEMLVSPEWVEERKKRWGVNSPIYQSKVLGEFPEIDDYTLIPPKWILAAQQREIPRNYAPKMGVDVARFGDDETCIYINEGGWARLHKTLHKEDTMKTAGHVAKAFRELSRPPVKQWPTAGIDVIGVGAGVYDRLSELGLDVAPLNASESPIDKERFVNARAEWYWNLRESFEAGEVDIDEDDDQLVSQLGAIRWDITSKGKILIESKDDMRKRGLPSPDRADALCYSFVHSKATVISTEAHRASPTVMGDLLNEQF